jgi:hypothetical protein
MPFLRAGFNGRNFDTGIRGWTRPIDGHRRFAPAELRMFACGDYFWYGICRPRFLAWGEACTLGSWHEFTLPWHCQEGLAHSDLDTREEHKAWDVAAREVLAA